MSTQASQDATEFAYREIRGRILGGEEKPGEKLREATIAARLELSRTPVRSALVRLAAEGLVELIPSRGAFVAQWSAADVEEIFGLRLALEPIVAALAARKIGTAELAELKTLADGMESALEAGAGDRAYVDEATELNARFHRVLMDAAGNLYLRSMLSAVIELPLMHRTVAEFEPERLAHAWAEHRELIAAMESRDEDLAAAVMRTHLLAARDIIRRMLDRNA